MARLNIIPIVGKKYHFFDDGKLSPYRHYIATVEEVIDLQEARRRYLEYYDSETIKPLSEIWGIEKSEHDWVIAKDTDYFVRCSIPSYDKYPIWFVRSTDDGWFSMNVQSSWQSGRLDVSGKFYRNIKQELDSSYYDGWYDNESGAEIID